MTMLHVLFYTVWFIIWAKEVSTSEQFWQDYGHQELLEVQSRVIRDWKAKNIILFVGDGFGLSEFVAARIFKGQQNSFQPSGEFHRLSMEEKLPFVALSKTFSTSNQVPDSSATAFAMFSGVKTASRTVGFSADEVVVGKCDPTLKGIPTIAHHFKQDGKRVGFVTTARVTHATPSALYAQTPKREWEASADGECADIASQLLNNMNLIDVSFGGGARNFVPKDSKAEFGSNSERQDHRNLINEWEAQGGEVVSDLDSLFSLKNLDAPVLGLFSDSHLNYEALGEKPSKEPTLQNMTKKALELLSSQESLGYFLMVEGGRIDHAQHYNNPYLMVTEAIAFDETVKMVLDKINLDETLVIVTADHSHAFSVMGYPTLDNPILGSSADDYSQETPPERFATLVYGAGRGIQTVEKKGVPPENANENFPGYNYPAAVNASKGKHGGEDVLILANGPMAHLFQGIRMQSYIGHVMQYASGTGFYRHRSDHLLSFSPSQQADLLIWSLCFLMLVKVGEKLIDRY